jgi:hypothetical protein
VLATSGTKVIVPEPLIVSPGLPEAPLMMKEAESAIAAGAIARAVASARKADINLFMGVPSFLSCARTQAARRGYGTRILGFGYANNVYPSCDSSKNNFPRIQAEVTINMRKGHH